MNEFTKFKFPKVEWIVYWQLHWMNLVMYTSEKNNEKRILIARIGDVCNLTLLRTIYLSPSQCLSADCRVAGLAKMICKFRLIGAAVPGFSCEKKPYSAIRQNIRIIYSRYVSPSVDTPQCNTPIHFTRLCNEMTLKSILNSTCRWFSEDDL